MKRVRHLGIQHGFAALCPLCGKNSPLKGYDPSSFDDDAHVGR